jgi:hypothetical protein
MCEQMPSGSLTKSSYVLLCILASYLEVTSVWSLERNLSFEWLVFIANLNSQVGWYNYNFPKSFQTNSAMLLQPVHNNILLYAAYKPALDAIELMELIDCRSINWYSVTALNSPVILGRKTGVDWKEDQKWDGWMTCPRTWEGWE